MPFHRTAEGLAGIARYFLPPFGVIGLGFGLSLRASAAECMEIFDARRSGEESATRIFSYRETPRAPLQKYCFGKGFPNQGNPEDFVGSCSRFAKWSLMAFMAP